MKSDEHSLTVGPGGPVLLQDASLIEQMPHFNREGIPERQPHAKGSGAFGSFEVTHDVSRYTKAAVFQPRTRTDLVIRFSTVARERGSPDTWRDPRGFAVKSCTSAVRREGPEDGGTGQPCAPRTAAQGIGPLSRENPMKTPDNSDTSPVDDETRQRSAEQRNITAPTPRDVRDKAKDDDEPDSPTADTS